MCGIAGTYRWPDGKVVTDRLTDTLAHRGPDGAGRYGHPVGDGEVHLGHRRLSIIDLSETGAPADGLGRPRPDATTASCTTHPSCGPSWRPPGVRFRGTSDTEVRARGLAALGHRLPAPVPRHVRVRDLRRAHRRAGAGPRPARHQAAVPACRRGEGLVFASELKALAAAIGAGAAGRPRARWWRRCSTTGCPISGARSARREKLPPGTLGAVPPGRPGASAAATGNLRTSPPRAASGPGRRAPDLRRGHRGVDAAPPASPTCRWRRFLSGGLDSSIVTVLAAPRPARDRRLHDHLPRRGPAARGDARRRCATPGRWPRSSASTCTRSRSRRTSSTCCRG